MDKFKKKLKISLFFIVLISSNQILFSLDGKTETGSDLSTGRKENKNPWDNFSKEELEIDQKEEGKIKEDQLHNKQFILTASEKNISRESSDLSSENSAPTGQTTPKVIQMTEPIVEKKAPINLKKIAEERFIKESAPVMEKIKRLRIQNSRSNMFELLNLDPKVSYTKKEVNDAYANEVLKWHPSKWHDFSPEIQEESVDIFKNLTKAHTVLTDGPNGLVTADQEEFDFLGARLTKAEIVKKINKQIDFSKPINLDLLTETNVLKIKNLACRLLSLDPHKFYTGIEIAKAGRNVKDTHNGDANVIDRGFEKNVLNITNLLRDIHNWEEKIENSAKIIDSTPSLSSLTPEQVKAINPISISRLTNSQISELKTDQIKHLSLNQIEFFSQDQINIFSDHKIEALKKRFMSLDPKEKDLKIFNDKLLSRTPKK
ncbi:MAG: hypothetical protein WC747_03400 [Candidatus Babeliales bacterium]|jgi:hypothetical protein